MGTRKIEIIKAKIDNQGVSYRLEGDITFKDRWISHERIIELFLSDQGIKDIEVSAKVKKQSEDSFYEN